ncbi:MAD2L1-binding protein-like [Arapaima gigas]
MSEELYRRVQILGRNSRHLSDDLSGTVVLRLRALGMDGTAESPPETGTESDGVACDTAGRFEAVPEKTPGRVSAHVGGRTEAEPLTAATGTPQGLDSQRGEEHRDLPPDSASKGGRRWRDTTADGGHSKHNNRYKLTCSSSSAPAGLTVGRNEVNSPAFQVALTGSEVEDGEIKRKAREKGCVCVVFPGTVTQDSQYKFVCEIIKCVLYQRQQLPMMYDQLVSYQRKQAASQVEDPVVRRPAKMDGWDWRKCQRTLREVEEVLQQLEILFSLSQVPRVLLLLGDTIMLPKELYEVNMEGLVPGAGGGRSLRTTSCLRQLFRTLFVADILSDTRPVRLMATTIMALGHRDCGVSWFRPKLNYRVPAQVKRHIISLSSDPALCGHTQVNPGDWAEYVWFQAPVTIKGFCK